jgi:hypothetical protein
MYSTIDDAVKLVVANKVDRSTEREVTFEQGAAFAKRVSPGELMKALLRHSKIAAHQCDTAKNSRRFQR